MFIGKRVISRVIQQTPGMRALTVDCSFKELEQLEFVSTLCWNSYMLEELGDGVKYKSNWSWCVKGETWTISAVSLSSTGRRE